jgi:signal transduction histidine kinase
MAVGLTLLALLAGGRNAGDVALICAPLALLAGAAIERLAESWQDDAFWVRDGILSLVVLIIVIYVAMQAAFYARAVQLNLQQSTQFLWFWLLAIALLILLGGFSLAWLGGRASWRAGGTVLALVLLLSSFSAATGLNYVRPNDPRELHVRVAGDKGMRDALEVMAELSHRRWGAPTAIPVTVEAGLGPVWSWYLRDWEDVTFVNELTSEVGTPMVISAEGLSGLSQSGGWNPSERYIGQDFVTSTWWGADQLYSNDQLSWWLYRKSISKPTPVQRVVLWIRTDEQAAVSE